jgi:radical SAM/Cys-rich protein
MKSLKAIQHLLSEAGKQLEVLETADSTMIPSFTSKMEGVGLFPLRPTAPEIFQMNLGKMCNQVCKHCHVDAGPDRKEIMTQATMLECLNFLDTAAFSSQNESASLPVRLFETIDLTGGAPEMNPHFRWLVEELSARGKKIIVRCNLTIIVANKKYNDLPDFFKKHGVEVVSSLPFYTSDRTDRQRGEGVFEQSIKALRLLNAVGYGQEGTGLTLNLVYNPAGAFLPPSQQALELEYKKALKNDFNITFNQLFAITNMPISRYLDYLLFSGNYTQYMQKLVQSFNPTAAAAVMCRNTLSVGWDGKLYDCDFNEMLELGISVAHQHISNVDLNQLLTRSIVLNQHCYGCTAGAGSSCGGTTS